MEIRSRGIRENRLNNILFSIRSFLTFCNRIYKIPGIIDPKKIKTLRLPSRPVEFLTLEELKQFFGSNGITILPGLRMRALCEFLIATNMRISEALGRNRADIDLESKRMTIIGKGDKQRKAFLNDRAIEWLQKYLLTRQDNDPALFVTFKRTKAAYQRLVQGV